MHPVRDDELEDADRDARGPQRVRLIKGVLVDDGDDVELEDDLAEDWPGDDPDDELGDEDDDVLEGEVVLDDGEPGSELAVVDDLVDEATGISLHAGHIVAGISVLFRRVWEARTLAPYQRMRRTAEALGDMEIALEWEAREADFRRDRHQRRMDLMELPARVIGVAPQAAAIAGGVLLGIGILLAVASRDPMRILAPFLLLAQVTAFLWAAAALLWLPTLLLTPVAAAAVFWHVGRRHGRAGDPTWAGGVGEADMDIAIDETTIARALGALGIPQISKHLREGLPLQYLTPARRDGRGTHARIRLPSVAAERVIVRRADLAAGLYRAAKETWPTTGDEAGILDLWVADKGALAEGAGAYPLLSGGFTDVFKGVPFGRTLRGDPIKAPLIGRNTIIGGQPEQGKSSAARVMMVGASLDPTAELRIWVPDSNYDFEVFKPRCSRYVMGAETEKIELIRDDLRELYEEVQTRGRLLVEHQEPEVTRAVADKVPGLHPLFCLLEEAHVALNHKVHGDEISWLYTEIVKLGRKRAIHMIPSTQAPTKNSMPRDITRNCTNGVAFAVGDHHANDALLGQGAYAAGHRATELIPGVDRGTALCKGFTGQRSAIVQVYFLSVARGNDQVTPLIERALKEIERRGKAVPGTDRPRAALEERDLLEDLDEALPTEVVRLADIPALLRELAPQWSPYQTLNGRALDKLLKEEGIVTTNTGNVRRLDPVKVRLRIAERATADLDEDE